MPRPHVVEGAGTVLGARVSGIMVLCKSHAGRRLTRRQPVPGTAMFVSDDGDDDVGDDAARYKKTAALARSRHEGCLGAPISDFAPPAALGFKLTVTALGDAD